MNRKYNNSNLPKINRLCLTLGLTIGILFSSMSTANAALSAVTAKTIQGTAPYLFLNNIKATDTSSLLGIKIGTDEYISDSAGNMQKVGTTTTFTTPINLPSLTTTLADVQTLITADNNLNNLNNLSIIPSSARRDDDGDNNFTITGQMKGSWTDKNGTLITTLNTPLSVCNAPYTLTLETLGSPSISTQYGSPKLTTFNNATAKFVVNPPVSPTICHALLPATTTGIWANTRYDGPATEWAPGYGFLPQSTSPSSYSKNFPTMAANLLYFDLDIGGSPNVLSWSDVTVGGITAKISNITSTKVRVTFSGPAPTTAQNTAKNPGTIAKVTTPATFVLNGKSGSTTVVSYGFVIKRWFIYSSGQLGNWTGGTRVNTTTWCNGTSNYTTTVIADLTNASGMGGYPLATIPTTTTVPSGADHLTRRIGGGLLSEWAQLELYNSYYAIYMSMGSYVTGSSSQSGYRWWVTANSGATSQRLDSNDTGIICRSR